MAAEISDRVRMIAEARGLQESEVFERALERGLEDLWEDLVLAQYLDDELDREEALDQRRYTSRTPGDRPLHRLGHPKLRALRPLPEQYLHRS